MQNTDRLSEKLKLLADEEQHWKLLDPIERVRVHLSRQGLADQDFFDSVNAEADANPRHA